MEPLTLAYLAGVMDSDGCISIKKSRNHLPKVSGEFTFTYGPWMQVGRREGGEQGEEFGWHGSGSHEVRGDGPHPPGAELDL